MYPKLFLNSEVSFSIFDFKLSFCLGKESHLQPSGDCDVVSDGVPTKEEEEVHVALALVQYYLSLNYLETEEFSRVSTFKFLLYHNHIRKLCIKLDQNRQNTKVRGALKI